MAKRLRGGLKAGVYGLGPDTRYVKGYSVTRQGDTYIAKRTTTRLVKDSNPTPTYHYHVRGSRRVGFTSASPWAQALFKLSLGQNVNGTDLPRNPIPKANRATLIKQAKKNVMQTH